MAKSILVLEDEDTLRLVLKKTLTRLGYVVHEADTVQKAREHLKSHRHVAAFLDIRLPDGNGLDLLSSIIVEDNPPACIVMTAEATMDNAIKAVKKGAFEYIVKPFDLDEVERILERIERQSSLAAASEPGQETGRLAARDAGKYEIIGQSKIMLKLFKKIGKAAASSFTVLITGESGSGKELVARNLHRFSDRAKGEFVVVNCGAIPKELMESELFGYLKGAFTGADSDRIGYVEMAHGGTLFLDEIGDLGPRLQAKLLRVLEDGKIYPLGSRRPVSVDVRFVAATNRNLSEMVDKKEFREDLYHRLNVIPISVPPLRNRKEDISPLALYFVKRYGGGKKKISDEACVELAARSWPGNVRQLLNAIKRAMVLSTEGVLLPSHFSAAQLEAPDGLEEWVARSIEKSGEKSGGKIYDGVMKQIEAELIRQALEKCGHNKVKAALLLGINRNTMTKKVKEYSL